MNTYLFTASNKHEERYLKYTLRKTLTSGKQRCDKNCLRVYCHPTLDGLRKVTIYLLTSCNAEEKIAQNIYINNSNSNYKKLTTTTTILIKNRIGIGYKNYGKQCPRLEFRLIPKLIGWAGLKPKKFFKFL